MEFARSEKKDPNYELDIKSGKTPRMEELESGQQEMQEKTTEMTKMVTNLTKRKGITDGPSLQREPISWKDGIDLSIVPDPNDHGE